MSGEEEQADILRVATLGQNPIFGTEGIFLDVLHRELWNEHQKFKRSWRPGEGAGPSVGLL